MGGTMKAFNDYINSIDFEEERKFNPVRFRITQIVRRNWYGVVLLVAYICIAYFSMVTEAQDIEAEQVTACLDLQVDEYAEWQRLAGVSDSVWDDYLQNPYRWGKLKMIYLDTKAGWQLIYYYFPKDGTAFVMTFDVEKTNPNNWTWHGDYWGIHPCGVFRVNRNDLLSIVSDLTYP